MQKGTSHTDEARQKISNALRGRVVGAETKQRMSESHKGARCYKFRHDIKDSVLMAMREEGNATYSEMGQFFNCTSATARNRYLSAKAQLEESLND